VTRSKNGKADEPKYTTVEDVLALGETLPLSEAVGRIVILDRRYRLFGPGVPPDVSGVVPAWLLPGFPAGTLARLSWGVPDDWAIDGVLAIGERYWTIGPRYSQE
jgi:hypothetical protein